VLALPVDEPLPIALRRTTIEQLDHALWVMRHELDRDRAVHEARKSLKRVRAVLRLVQGPLGEYRFGEENAVLRDVSRRLSVVRSAAVIVDTARTFTEAHPDLLDPIATRRLLVGLAHRRDTMRTVVIHDRQMIADLATALLTTRSRYAAWPITEMEVNPAAPHRRPFRNEFATVAGGLERTYVAGMNGMETAIATRSTFAFHEWRKRVKYLRYQHELLEPLWPAVMGATATSFGELADGLGAEHDLAEVGALVASTPTLILDPAARYRFLSAGERRRMTLHSEVVALGRRLFAETPTAFRRRIGSYWAYARG